MDVTLDVVSWCKLLLITTKEELLLKTDDCDMVALGEPLNRKTIVDIHGTNGNGKLDKIKRRQKKKN